MTSDKHWTKDVNVIVKKEKLLEFFPNKLYSSERNGNAVMRFCLYSGILVSAQKKNHRYLILFLVIGIVLSHSTVEYFSPFVKLQTKNTKKEKCVMPTSDNPMANFLMSEYESNPDRPEACKYMDHTDEYNNAMKTPDEPFDVFNTKYSERQFFTTANTTAANEQRQFADWLYGNKSTEKEEALIKYGFH